MVHVALVESICLYRRELLVFTMATRGQHAKGLIWFVQLIQELLFPKSGRA